jgi:hypothetical protein
LVHIFSRITLYNALAVSIILYGSKIWSLKKRIKTIDTNQDEIFQNWVHPFWPEKELRNFGRVENRTS